MSERTSRRSMAHLHWNAGRRARARGARRRGSRCRRAAAQRIAAGTSTTSSRVAGIDRRGPRRRATRARQLGAVQQRIGVGPLLRRVAEALRRLRRPERMAQLPQERQRQCRPTSVALKARSTATSQSCGVRNLRASRVHASGRSTSARATRREVAVASRGTRARCARPPRRRLVGDEVRDELRRDEPRGRRVAAQRADGVLALVRRRPRRSVTPSTVFAPGSCSSSWNAKPIGPSGAICAAGRPRPRAAAAAARGRPSRPPTVQPVRIFASSCTSCCV